MKHKSLLIVSPGGTSVKAIRIKGLFIFIAIVFIVGGFSAYFIPAEKFRLNSAEVRQKQRLADQNKMLHQRIESSLGMLDRLRQQIVCLDEKKTRVVELTGAKTEQPHNRKSPAENRAASYEGLDPETLLGHAVRLDSQLTSFAAQVSSGGGNRFNDIPVCKPTPDCAIVALGFGKTRDPFTGRTNWHRGLDFAAAAGTPVVATAAGCVARAERDAVWGNRIVINHADSISTVYAHLGTIRTATGRKVKRGEVIGTIGISGLTTGPHVHYEIRRNEVQVDPAMFFYPVQAVKN